MGLCVKIGIHSVNHNTRRNIIEPAESRHKIVRVYDVGWFLRRTASVLPMFPNDALRYTAIAPSVGDVDIVHLFNQVRLGGTTPWVATTSIGLPLGRSGLVPDQLAKDSLKSPLCRRIICTSEFAYAKQLAKCGNDPAVMEKVCMLPPPQRLGTEEGCINDADNGPLRIIFVGHDFFRKGGAVVLFGLEKLIRAGKVELIIVSEHRDRYKGRFSPSQKVDYECSEIEKLPGVRLFSSLDNHRVIEMIQSSQLAVLPSHSETYGYFVLEAQSCGVPVITSNVGAFREINDASVGWILESGNGTDDSAIRLMAGGLETIVANILEDRTSLNQKSVAARKRIARKHDVDRHARLLSELYYEAHRVHL